MPSEFHISVKAALIRDSEMLVLHTGQSFDLPGGRIEKGETPISALMRELSEELPGVTDAEIGELVGWHLFEAYAHEDTGLIVMIFEVQANLPSPLQLSDEHESAEWLSINEAKEALSDFNVRWSSDL